MPESNPADHADTKSVLVVGAHYDDCEAGAVTGTILRFIEMGYQVVFLNTMAPVWGYLDNHSQEELEQLNAESRKAAAILGIEKITLDYASPPCPSADPELTRKIAGIYLDISPEFVFIPWPRDNHVDHERTARSAFAAICYPHRFVKSRPVRLREIFAYHISPWQTVDFNPDFCIDVSRQMPTVDLAMNAFSALAGFGPIAHSVRRIWGCGHCEYAEGFIHLGPGFPMQSRIPQLFGDSFFAVGSGQYPWGGRYFQ